MAISAKSYPQPVLGNGDDLGGAFGVEYSYRLSRESVAIDVSFALHNEAIEGLLTSKTASFIVEVESPEHVLPQELRDERTGHIDLDTGHTTTRRSETQLLDVCAGRRCISPILAPPRLWGCNVRYRAGRHLSCGRRWLVHR